MQEHQERLQNAPAIGTRLQRAVTLQAVGDAIDENLPTIGNESDFDATMATPQQLQGSFRGAFEARQRRQHPRRKYTKNPAAVVAALKEALPAKKAIRPTRAEARHAYGDIINPGATLETCRPDDIRIPDEYEDITLAQWQQEARAYNALPAARKRQKNAPLNPDEPSRTSTAWSPIAPSRSQEATRPISSSSALSTPATR